METYAWRIADGRIWSGYRGKFVSAEELDSEELVSDLYENGELGGIDDLRNRVLFYHKLQPDVYSLGELRSQQEWQAYFTEKIQARLDDFARTRGYDNAIAAASYATSATPRFFAEGQRMVDLRDQTWAKGYDLLATYQDYGKIPTWEELEAQLPKLEW